MDKNGDGKIAIEEWLKKFKDLVEEQIREALADYKKDLMEQMLEEFKKLDQNGDGFLTQEEIKAVMDENEDRWGQFDFDYFDALDRNKDGKISFEEWAGESLKELDNLGEGFDDTFLKKNKLMQEMIAEFREYDINGDGYVTREEIQTVMEKNVDKWGLFDFGFFEDLDTNNDGKLNIEEWTCKALAELDFIEIGLETALKELNDKKDGSITLSEIKQAYDSKGRKFSEADKKIFEAMDKDDSGKISIDEFCKKKNPGKSEKK